LLATTPALWHGTRASAGQRPLPAARLAKPVAAVLYHVYDGFAAEGGGVAAEGGGVAAESSHSVLGAET